MTACKRASAPAESFEHATAANGREFACGDRGGVPPALPRRDVFPPWSSWDALAVLGFTVVGDFAVQHHCAGDRARGHQQASRVCAATWRPTPSVVIGAQLAAYPVVILFMIALVRSKSDERFLAGDPLELARTGDAWLLSLGNRLCRGGGVRLALSAHSQVAARGQILQRRRRART